MNPDFKWTRAGWVFGMIGMVAAFIAGLVVSFFNPAGFVLSAVAVVLGHRLWTERPS